MGIVLGLAAMAATAAAPAIERAVRIKRVAASPEVTHRLRELGLCEEQKIKLLSRRPNLVCLVCNARLAISSQLAETILVEPIPSTARAD